MRTSGAEPANEREVFYAAYGSNLCAERFGCYLSGGRPPGLARTHTRGRVIPARLRPGAPCG